MTQQRLVMSLLIGVGAVLLLVILQNPARTTLDVLLWTFTIRQGFSLVLAFSCGVLAGWGAHLVSQRLRKVQPPGHQNSDDVSPSDASQSTHHTP